MHGRISLAPVGGVSHNRRTMPAPREKRPHPFQELRDAPPAEKRAMVCELYSSGRYNSTDLWRMAHEKHEVVLEWIRGMKLVNRPIQSAERVTMPLEEVETCVACGGPAREKYLGEWLCEGCHSKSPVVQASEARRERAREILATRRDADQLRKAIKRVEEALKHGEHH